MLRKIRIAAAIVGFSLITLLFLDFTGTLHRLFGWLADIQFLPALLAVNVLILLGLVVLTFLLGRMYCSVICPFGVYQDIVSWLAGKWNKNRFSFSPARSRLRYGVLIVCIIAVFGGVGALASLLEPYSAYGRIASNILAPVYRGGNNILAYVAERVESYAVYSVDIWVKSVITLMIAVVTLVAITVLAWRGGRTYCNTICPVGTVLGLISHYSLFKPVLDTEKCNSCGLCARNCKASCIDPTAHSIDYSRCVVCLNCLEKCPQHAIRYIPRYKARRPAQAIAGSAGDSPNTMLNARRSFLSAAALCAFASTVNAQQEHVEGGLAEIEEKKIPTRATPISPPGSQSARSFTAHCTACGLCISACPNQVLRPSHALTTFMQPEMSYERGYCRPECVRCSEVCPTNAISLLTVADKSAIQIGHAVWIQDNCVVKTDEVSCGNCARHCPTGAITMVLSDPQNPDSLEIPTVDTERCIGCGACENLCPARPFSAIYVEGHEMHRIV